MKKETLGDTEILGILLHFSHLFSGYKDQEIADYAKGFVMGITMALELAGAIDSHNILPDGKIHEKKGTFGICQFFRGFFYTKHICRESIQDPINVINTLDFSKVMKDAEEEMIRLIGSKAPFFVDPGKKTKQ